MEGAGKSETLVRAFLLVMDATASGDARRLRQDWVEALRRAALLPSNDNEPADNAPLDMVRAMVRMLPPATRPQERD